MHFFSVPVCPSWCVLCPKPGLVLFGLCEKKVSGGWRKKCMLDSSSVGLLFFVVIVRLVTVGAGEGGGMAQPCCVLS